MPGLLGIDFYKGKVPMGHLPMSGGTKKKSSPRLGTVLDVWIVRPTVEHRTGNVQMALLCRVEKLVDVLAQEIPMALLRVVERLRYPVV